LSDDFTFMYGVDAFKDIMIYGEDQEKIGILLSTRTKLLTLDARLKPKIKVDPINKSALI